MNTKYKDRQKVQKKTQKKKKKKAQTFLQQKKSSNLSTTERQKWTPEGQKGHNEIRQAQRTPVKKGKRKRERQKDRKTERQRDRKTERQKDRKTDKQTNRKQTNRTNLMTIFNVGTEDSWLKMSDTVLSFSKQMSNSEIGLQFVSKSSPVIDYERLG
jgi:hypothetical protein